MARVKLKIKLAGETALELQQLLEAGDVALIGSTLSTLVKEALEEGRLDVSLKVKKALKKAKRDEKSGEAEATEEKAEKLAKVEKQEKLKKPGQAAETEAAAPEPVPAKKSKVAGKAGKKPAEKSVKTEEPEQPGKTVKAEVKAPESTPEKAEPRKAAGAVPAAKTKGRRRAAKKA